MSTRALWKPVPSSLRTLAEDTGLSKSAVQTAPELLRRRQLIETTSDHDGDSTAPSPRPLARTPPRGGDRAR